ncbi:MAG: serine hydrolase, partial [Verrucomicrobiota bacterium]
AFADRFGRLDRNGDGALTREELAEARSLTWFSEADSDENGRLSLGEIQAHFRDRVSPSSKFSGEPLIIEGSLPENAPVTRQGIEAAARYSSKQNGFSFLVFQDGEVRYERYDQGHGPESAFRLASGTKSFSAAILAAGKRDGFLDLDEKVSATITEWKGEEGLAEITVRQLLQLTSGIEPGDNGRVPSYADAVSVKSVAKPGSGFRYGPTAFQVFGELVKRKLEAEEQFESADPLAYLEARVLEPIGLSYENWRRDADGFPHLPSGAFLTARSWAKYGELLLAEGLHGGKQILDPDVLRACLKGSDANPGYGWTFWLLGEKADKDRPWLAGAYMAAGAGKQRLYVLPQPGIVVVRQGESRKFEDGHLLDLLFEYE